VKLSGESKPEADEKAGESKILKGRKIPKERF